MTWSRFFRERLPSVSPARNLRAWSVITYPDYVHARSHTCKHESPVMIGGGGEEKQKRMFFLRECLFRPQFEPTHPSWCHEIGSANNSEVKFGVPFHRDTSVRVIVIERVGIDHNCKVCFTLVCPAQFVLQLFASISQTDKKAEQLRIEFLFCKHKRYTGHHGMFCVWSPTSAKAKGSQREHIL